MNLWEWVSNVNNLTGLIISASAIIGFVYYCYSRLYNLAHKIYLEFSPNGGSSLKDQINRLESFFKASLRMHGKLFWIFDKKGKCIDVSEQLCVLLGKTPTQIYGDGWINSIDKKDSARIIQQWTLSIERQIEFNEDYSLVSSTNEVVKIKSHRIPMFINKNSEYELIGYLGWIDIIKNLEKSNETLSK